MRKKQRSHLSLERLEARTVLTGNPGATLADLAVPAYSFDGTGNNLTNPDWGSAGIDLLRTAAAAYADGLSAPAGADRPSPRAISNALGDQSGHDIISNRLLSAMIYAWGQFIDHDLD